MKLFLYFSLLMLCSLGISAQDGMIDSDFNISLTNASFNDDGSLTKNVYSIDLSGANFSNEAEANKLFQFFSKHPLFDVTVQFAESIALIKVITPEKTSTGTFDKQYLENAFARRTLAYNRNN